MDGGDYCIIKGVEAAPIFRRQLGDDAGVVVGIPTKEDRLRCLPGQVIIGLMQL